MVFFFFFQSNACLRDELHYLWLFSEMVSTCYIVWPCA